MASVRTGRRDIRGPPRGRGEGKGDKLARTNIGHSSVRFLDPIPAVVAPLDFRVGERERLRGSSLVD